MNRLIGESIKTVSSTISAYTIEYEVNSSTHSTISSTNRIKSRLTSEERQAGSDLGIDSHADVSCIGKHARVLEIVEGSKCTVKPFNDSYSPLNNIQIVHAAIAAETNDGETCILKLNNALDFRDSMDNSLLCTNQARHNSIVVDDVPPAVDLNRTSTFSIYFPNEDKRFPLQMKGPCPQLHFHYPSDWELMNCPQLNLTDGDVPWETSFFEENQKVSAMIMDLPSDPIIDAMMHNDYVPKWMAYIGKYQISAITSLPGEQTLTAEYLSDLWNISLDQAAHTLKNTTHDSIRLLDGIISRRVKTLPHQRMYNHLSGYLGKFASDTAKANVKSLRGNNYVQIFSNRGNYVKIYPMKLKSDAPDALHKFVHDVGVPHELLTDNAPELIHGEWKKRCRKYQIYQKFTEPHSPWQNPAELTIGIMKRSVKRLMMKTNTPVRLWDFCWQYLAELRCLTAVNNVYLEGGTPYQKVHGYTPNIAEFLIHKWFDWVWFHDPNDPDTSILGRWLGPAHDATQGMAYHILKSNGEVVVRSTVHRLSNDEMVSPEIKIRKDNFTKQVESIIGNYSKPTLNNTHVKNGDIYENLFETIPHEDECIDIHYDENGDFSRPDLDSLIPNEAPFQQLDDKLLGLHVQLPVGGEMKEGVIKSRKRNFDGTLVGKATSNPLTDTREYEVDFGDGNYYEYTANVILENLYSQVDDYGRSHSMFSGIVDHEKDSSAIPIENGWYISDGGKLKKRVITTKGWKFLVEWRDGTKTWIPLKDLKESNPLELAEYAKSRKIDKEPALAWWSNYVLKKRNRIIKQVSHRLPKKSMKFGIVVPGSVNEALALDKKNGDTFWRDALDKELKNVLIAFKLLQDGENIPVGSKEIPYHIIFDVKFDLTRKARLVAGGHRNKDIPSHVTYSSVASRDSVRIAFLIAAANDLDVVACDIGNAFLNAPNRERVHVKVGKELFGPENEGKIAIIVRALYGLKSASAAWRHHFFTTITKQLNFKPTFADPDVYRKARIKPDGTRFYAYLIIYVDDVLCVDINPHTTIEQIGSTYRVKEGSNKFPDMYLGMDVRKWEMQDLEGNLISTYALGANSYIKEAVRIAKAQCLKHQLDFPTSKKESSMPFTAVAYRPELEASKYCTNDLHTLYQNFIGMLRWACELGRVDIFHEVSLLSQYLSNPRIGHLKQAINIFHYLSVHNRSWMVVDPTSFEVEWKPNKSQPSPDERASAMKELYPDAEELIPHNAPEPLGESIDINVFVDADHAGNRITRRSHTGIIIFGNMAPLMWYSKRQNTVETSTFGSEIIALRIAIELVEGLRYKLRMFGVPLKGPARIFCDNESVVNCTTNVESKLKKKHASVSYGKIKCSLAASIVRIYYEKTNSNIADLLTKVLPLSTRLKLIKSFMN